MKRRTKKGMTRALAVLLSIGMLTGGTNITAFAEDYPESPEDEAIVSVSPEGDPTETDNLWDGVTMESIYEGDGFQVKFSNRGTSDSTVLSDSGAKVQVYRGNEPTPINEFTVTQNQVGTYWNVFELTVDSNHSVNIEAIDTYSDNVLYQ